MASNYTIELWTLMNDPMYEIFDFDMPFYTDDEAIKKEFQEKFLREYAFHEIGQETVARWKWQLQAKLHRIMPYYKQLYITELKSKNIEFLLNKDYTETYTRNLTKDTEENSKVDTTTENTSTGTVSNTATGKVSDIANGVSDIGLTQGKLTGMSEDKSNGTQAQNINGSQAQTATSTGLDNENESYTLVGKGNIGTTSSAELLERWRDVLINIDAMILDECRDLFMTIY